MQLLKGDKGGSPPSRRARAVLYGAPSDIRDVARRLRASGARYRVIGALATAPLTSARIAGAPILASGESTAVLSQMRPGGDFLVVASPFQSTAAARALLDRAVRTGHRVLLTRAEGEDGLAVRPMSLSDLIGAATGEVDWASVRGVIAGRRILVTGGAGSIGGELSRRIAGLNPAALTVLDNSEFNLFTLGHELDSLSEAPPHQLRFCDIRDEAAVARAIERAGPDIVFHAAAMKHVPLVEANASEGVLTNVMGARHVATAAAKVGAHLVFVSTDKAVNPVSVMGATKRLVELYCQALDREAPAGGPRRLTARLGNVLGSAGSVAPVFERQLAAGGPLTVTDPEVSRYFITISQAADFLLQATAVGFSRDDIRGVAYVLDMGEPLPVQELARDMIRLSGLRPDRDVAIEFIGLRPGEKLCEELVADDEQDDSAIWPGVKAVRSPPVPLAEIARRLDRVVAAASAGGDDVVRRMLREYASPARVRVAS